MGKTFRIKLLCPSTAPASPISGGFPASRHGHHRYQDLVAVVAGGGPPSVGCFSEARRAVAGLSLFERATNAG